MSRSEQPTPNPEVDQLRRVAALERQVAGLTARMNQLGSSVVTPSGVPTNLTAGASGGPASLTVNGWVLVSTGAGTAYVPTFT
jgi:hypothetical protein